MLPSFLSSSYLNSKPLMLETTAPVWERVIPPVNLRPSGSTECSDVSAMSHVHKGIEESGQQPPLIPVSLHLTSIHVYAFELVTACSCYLILFDADMGEG